MRLRKIPILILLAISCFSTALFAKPKYSAKVLTADQILDAVYAKYGSCKSFIAESVSYDSMASVTATGGWKSETYGKIWFKRPDLVRIDHETVTINPGTSVIPETKKPGRKESIFTRNGEIYVFEDPGMESNGLFKIPKEFLKKTYLKSKDLDMTVVGYGSQEDLNDTIFPLLRGAKFSGPFPGPWTRRKDTKLDGKPCYILSSVTHNAGVREIQWTILQSSMEIVRSTESQSMTAEESKVATEEQEKKIGKFPGSGDVESKPFHHEKTTLYGKIQWDPELIGPDFDYVLPKDAKLVTAVEKEKSGKNFIEWFYKLSAKWAAKNPPKSYETRWAAKDPPKSYETLVLEGKKRPRLNLNGPNFLLDNFECAAPRDFLGGTWRVFIDGHHLGTTVEPVDTLIQEPGAGGKGHCIRLKGHFGKNVAPWPYAALMGGLLPPRSDHLVADFSKMNGLEFMARGDGKRYQVSIILDQDTNFGNYQAEFVAPKKWTKVHLKFDQFKQPSWGKPVPREFGNVTDLSFGPSKFDDEDFELYLDEIALVK